MPHLSLSLKPATGELATLRRTMRSFFSDHEEPAGDWLLIATELVTNAIAVAPKATAIEVFVHVLPSRIELRVVDSGRGFDFHPRTSVSPNDERGRGLMMVNALADHFSVEVEDGRTVAVASRTRPLRFDV